MPRNIFDNDEELFDYGAIDELAAMGIGDRGFININPPMNANELLEDQFERRAREIDRKPPGMQSMHLVPLKNGPWSANNQLGIEQPFAPATNNEQTILKLDEWGFPETWQITLGIEFDRLAQTAAGGGFDVVAKIVAGSGGAVQEFECDWINGTSFPVNFNALNVIAKYNSPLNVPNDLRLRVSIGRCGSGSHVLRPQLTRQFSADAAPANSALVEIPRFAVGVKLIGNGSASLAAEVFNVGNALLYHPTNNTALNGALNASQLLSFMSGEGAPLPVDARYLSYSNGSSGAGVSGRMIFLLGI